MFGMIANTQPDTLPTSTEYDNELFEKVCKDNIRLIELNNDLQIRLAELQTGLDLSLPYEQEEKK